MHQHLSKKTRIEKGFVNWTSKGTEKLNFFQIYITAWTTLSGILSLSKWASLSIKLVSWSKIGPALHEKKTNWLKGTGLLKTTNLVVQQSMNFDRHQLGLLFQNFFKNVLVKGVQNNTQQMSKHSPEDVLSGFPDILETKFWLVLIMSDVTWSRIFWPELLLRVHLIQSIGKISEFPTNSKKNGKTRANNSTNKKVCRVKNSLI